MNIVSLEDFKKKKDMNKNIEELNIKVCTYNFLKKLKVGKIADLIHVDWLSQLALEGKGEQIIEDLKSRFVNEELMSAGFSESV